MLGERKQETETNEQQEESIWEIPCNVTTDIPQSLQEATPNPYPVGSLPIRISRCHREFLFRYSTGYTGHAQRTQDSPAQRTIPAAAKACSTIYRDDI